MDAGANCRWCCSVRLLFRVYSCSSLCLRDPKIFLLHLKCLSEALFINAASVLSKICCSTHQHNALEAIGWSQIKWLSHGKSSPTNKKKTETGTCWRFPLSLKHSLNIHELFWCRLQQLSVRSTEHRCRSVVLDIKCHKYHFSEYEINVQYNSQVTLQNTRCSPQSQSHRCDVRGLEEVWYSWSTGGASKFSPPVEDTHQINRRSGDYSDHCMCVHAACYSSTIRVNCNTVVVACFKTTKN